MAEPAPDSTLGKIATYEKSPYMFPEDIVWTDTDCATMFNMSEKRFSTWVLL